MKASETAKSVRIARVAELLVWSRKNHARLQEIPADVRPRDLTEAYEIQVAVALVRAVPLSGFKIGLTNTEAQRATGASEPIVGRLGLLDIRRTQSRIELPANHLRVIEAEVIFEVSGDLSADGAPFTEQRVAASLGRAFAGIELCNSRIEEGGAGPLASLVADNSNSDLILVGDPLPQWDAALLANLPVTLQRSGKPLVQGSSSRVLGNPLRSVTWLANWLARHGEGLRRGQLIASGSCTGMTEIAAEESVVATFGERAQVCVEFTPAAEKNEEQA